MNLNLDPTLLAPSMEAPQDALVRQENESDERGITGNISLAAKGAARTTLTTDLAVAAGAKLGTFEAVDSMLEAFGGKGFRPADDMPKTEQEVMHYFKARNVAPEKWESLLKRSISFAHLEHNVGLEKDTEEAQAALADSGSYGSAASLITSMADPASGGAALGLFKLGAAASRGIKTVRGLDSAVAFERQASRIGAMALSGGIGGAGVEYITDGLNEVDDAASDALKSAAIGTASGLLLDGLFSGLQTLASKRRLAALEIQAAREQGEAISKDTEDAIVHGELPPGDQIDLSAYMSNLKVGSMGEYTARGLSPQAFSVKVNGQDVPLQFNNWADNALYALKRGDETQREALLEELYRIFPGTTRKDLLDASDEIGTKIDQQVAQGEVVVEGAYKDTVKPVFAKTSKEVVEKTPDPDLEVHPEINNQLIDSIKNSRKARGETPKAPKGPTQVVEEVDPADIALGPLQPFRSKVYPSKLHQVLMRHPDGTETTLRFESNVDRDLYRVSFDNRPKDFTKRMNNLKRAFPEKSEEDILEIAREFREDIVRRRRFEFPNESTLDFAPAYPSLRGPNRTQTLASVALATAGVGLIASTAEDAQAATGGAVAAVGGALQAGAGLAALVASRGRAAGYVGRKLRDFGVKGKAGEIPTPVSEFASRYGESNSAAATALMDDLLTSNLGRSGRALNKIGADAHLATLMDRTTNNFNVSLTAAVAEFAKSKGLHNVLNSVDLRERVLDEFNREFVRHKMNPSLNDVPAARKLADDMVKMMDETLEFSRGVLEQAKKEGLVIPEDSGLDEIHRVIRKNDPAYVRLVFNNTAVEDMVAIPGNVLEDAIKEAVKRANPGVSDKTAGIRAGLFVKTVLGLKADPDVMRMVRTSPDAALQQLINQGLVTTDTAEDVLSVLRMLGPDQQPGITQTRFSMDRDYRHKYVDANGAQQELWIMDLYSHDPSAQLFDWARQVNGETALTLTSLDRGFGVDLSSRKAFEAIREVARGQGAKAEEITQLDAAYNFVKGTRDLTNTFGERSAHVSSILQVTSALLSRNFWAAIIPEGFSGLLGAQLARAHRKTMPGLSGLFKAMTGRPATDPLSRQVAAISGMGIEGIGLAPRHQLEHGGLIDRSHNKVKAATSKVFLLNGVTGLNNYFKVFYARGMAQFISDVATGAAKVSDEYLAKTLNPLGMDRASVTELGVLLKKHASYDNKGILKDLGWDAIQKENPRLAAVFASAIRKHAKLSMSEAASVGSSSPLLQNDLGALVGQFVQTIFVVQARAIKDMHNMTPDVAAKWTLSFVAASAAYVGRTYMQFSEDEAQLEARLKMSEIMKAGFRNSAFAGFVPTLLDAASVVAGQGPVFANQTGRGFGSLTPPALGLAEMGFNTVSTASRALQGDTITQGEARKALMPLQMGQWWTQPLVNILAEDLPVRRPRVVEED